MPIVSVCPYCNRGRVRASEDDLGTTAKCPSCGSEFTVIPTEEPATTAVSSAGSSGGFGSSSVVPAVFAEDTAHRRSPPPAPPEPLAAETLPDAKPVPADDTPDPEDLPDPARLPAMVTVAVALSGVVAWMIPDYGRLVWLGLAVVSAGVGGWSLLAADRTKRFAWIALGAAGGSLLLCLLLPWMLGEGWWPARGYNADEAVAVGANGEQTDGRKPIDATKAVWFKDGVRVAVVSVQRGTEDVTTPAPKGKKPVVKKSPEVLKVVVEVSNEGCPTAVPFAGWTDATPPVFRTADDAEIVRHKFDGSVPGEPPAKPLPLGVGGSARQTLYFVPPPAGSGGGGLLTLPPAAFGGTGEPVRFMVPYSGFNKSEFQPGGGR